MYKTIAAGDVDVISAYTSDGQISTYDLTVLADDKHAIPPYDAILLVSRKRADDGKLITALRPLIDSIDVATMREANNRASNGSATPDEVALWLNNETARKR